MSQRSKGKLNPGLKSPAIATVLVICLATGGQSQEKFGYLREWIGKYPTYNNSKPQREFLRVRAIRLRLQRLLSARDFQFVTKTCGKETPIEERDGYLIVHRCHSYACAKGTALIIVRLADGIMHVAVRSEADTEARWYSSAGSYTDLPFSVANGWSIRQSAA